MKESPWNEIWSIVHKPTIIGNISQRMTFKIMDAVLHNFLRDYSLIDIGCGSGLTMEYFKSRGFKNVIGIDNSPYALLICKDKGFVLGKDIFDIDASDMPYKDRSFDVVFSWGLLEHFSNYRPFVSEMVRVSKKYIVLVQPNVHSFYGRILFFLTNVFKRGVEEFPYHIEDFIKAFKEYGCNHLVRKASLFKEFEVLVFEVN